jgi:hypothetical protein
MFYVYGISMTAAKKDALKTTKRFNKKVKGKPEKELTQDEYEALVIKNTLIKFKKMKAVRLSYSLSTPTLCNSYIELANKQEPHRDLSIRHKVDTGKVNPKTKKAIYEWVIQQVTPKWVDSDLFNTTQRNELVGVK